MTIIYYVDTETTNSGNFIVGVIYSEQLGKVWTVRSDYALYEFIKNNSGVYFAHGGGSFDWNFCLQYIKNEDSVEIIFVGSRIFRMKINDSILYDTIFLMTSSLDELAKKFGYKKAKIEYETVNEYSDEIRDACENHTITLAKVHNAFCEFFGISKLRIFTIAQLSHHILNKEYYKLENIKLESINNEYFRHFYMGGRNEIYEMKASGINIYDVNSLYPCAMTFKMPIGDIKESKKISNKSFLINCDVNIDRYIPPIPLRGKGYTRKLEYFNGRYNVDIWRPEFELLNNKEIIKINYVYDCETFDNIFENFVKDMYKKRMSGGELEKFLYKLILNSSYGKFAQNPQREIWTNQILEKKKIRDMGYIQVYEDFNEYKYQNTVIAGYITSVARSILYKYFEKVNFDVVYCDTDSIFTRQKLKETKELGGVKCEGTDGEFMAIQPKMYMYKSQEKKVVKGKGFMGFSEQNFIDLMSGKSVKFRRYKKAKQTLREREFGIIENIKKLITKYDKRVIEEDGIHTKALWRNDLV